MPSSSLLDTDLDDEGWTDMPVILPESNTLLDVDDRKRYHWAPSTAVPLDSSLSTGTGNATGTAIDYDVGGNLWREKVKLDEMDYTRLELDDDPEEDEISMRTQYLFDEEKGMTPLAQMQTTKTLLTEGQRIAYVGLCRLVAREMVHSLGLAAKGAKELDPALESANNWAIKIMGRLYRHMEVDAPEQRMIEQLAEHGVTAEDLVPSLLTTYTVDNPEYDPEAVVPDPLPPSPSPIDSLPSEPRLPEINVDGDTPPTRTDGSTLDEDRLPLDAATAIKVEKEKRRLSKELKGLVAREVEKIERRTSLTPEKKKIASLDPFGQDEEEEPFRVAASSKLAPPPISTSRDPFSDDFEGEDIRTALDDEDEPATPRQSSSRVLPSLSPPPRTPTTSVSPNPPSPPTPPSRNPLPSTPPPPASPVPLHQPENFLEPLPTALPGVSTTLTAADKTITLDIRWTILCDLFLSLIADSVYDARSRVLLGKVADKLGLEWFDVVRFERRMTDALEIQEGVMKKEHDGVLEDQRKKGKRQRLVMMGLATLGGGLVIGLSAGLLAPVIGAGLGAALTTIGVTGTTGFLAGAGGAAIVTSGATITGSVIGGKAMAKRTRHVKTFEFQPLHNNKRVNFYITVPGFMNGPLDDVRLPFSTIDPVMGDVFSVLWEPEMMGDTGNALKILTSEVLTQVGQQVLAMTVMTALLSALQWPLMLTKLGYLIDNPWSNALDRARQAGSVLADILIHRHLGVRPVSLVGFSLGARVIFFALVELAKAKAFGVVEEVYLFGATLTASKKVWRQVRGVVSGRFVNAYAMNDWVLGYLFRATSGGLNTVAGLRPIDFVPDLENVDITDILVGHMSYRTLMPTLLAHVGFKVTADHFDEPEEMEKDAPEREVLTPEEEERRKEEKRRGPLAKIFKKKSNKPGSAGVGGSQNSGSGSTPNSRRESLDEDGLPRRSSISSRVEGNGYAPFKEGSNLSDLSISSRQVEGEEDDRASEEGDDDDQTINLSPVRDDHDIDDAESFPPPPSTATASVPSGFDLDKLRKEVAQLPRDLPSSSPSAVPLPFEIARAKSVPAPSLAAADLTALDTTLDPREALQKLWSTSATSEEVWSSPSSSSLATNPFASSTPSLTIDRPPSPVTLTFGTAEGDLAWGSSGSDIVRSPLSDDTPDPAASFNWGQKNSSSATLNPW